jgi:aspartyl-tRNA(Asn)/glutamyl-tRNA(Gln) amidotransferase subunit B
MSDPMIITSPTTGADWELVVGLEVHAELATDTKMFSGAPNVFGGEPNTNIDPVTLGLPGSLPVVNEKAVELGIRVGLALNCTVARSTFARKNYFYPDMPKDYQISQFDEPLNIDGFLELPDGQRAGIERAHLEEDTGKSTHQGGDGRIHGAASSLVDYNRAGVPLIEIVGRPDLTSPEQARAYVSELRSILVAIGASDGKMEEGSMRVDANVSVRLVGDPELGTRCEVKNVNSLRSLVKAIEYEARRQVDVIEAGERVHQETRHWDEEHGRTRAGRSKEGAEDYRYFLEPDLVVLDPSAEWIDSIRAAMPVLPCTSSATSTGWPWPRSRRVPTRVGCSTTSSTTSPSTGPTRSTSPTSRPSCSSSSRACSPRPRPSRCWPRWSRPVRIPTRSPRRAGSRPWTPPISSRPSTASSRPTPPSGPSSSRATTRSGASSPASSSAR